MGAQRTNVWRDVNARDGRERAIGFSAAAQVTGGSSARPPPTYRMAGPILVAVAS